MPKRDAKAPPPVSSRLLTGESCKRLDVGASIRQNFTGRKRQEKPRTTSLTEGENGEQKASRTPSKNRTKIEHISSGAAEKQTKKRAKNERKTSEKRLKIERNRLNRTFNRSRLLAICSRYARDMLAMCSRYARDVLAVFSQSARDLLAICSPDQWLNP